MASNEDISKKLDRVLEILEKKENMNSVEKYEDHLREEIKEYMLTNFNISWINDDIEESVYDAILNIFFSAINKFIK